MLNFIKGMLPAASKMLGVDQNRLMEAYEQAQATMQAVQNPAQALEKAGVDKEFIAGLSKQVNTPMGNKILSFAGISPKQAEEVLSALTGKGLSNTSSTDDLAKFKRGLDSL